MSKFYVGQRVRIIHSPSGKFQGKEAVVRRFGDWPRGTPTKSGTRLINNCNVSVDIPHFDEDMATHTDFLEPIVDDGRQVIEWSECCFDRDGSFMGSPVELAAWNQEFERDAE